MPAGRICWGNWRTAMAYRSMSPLCTAVRGGITGGITSWLTYFGMVVGSSVPPGSWASACGRPLPPRTKNEPPATAPVFRKSRRVSMYSSFAKAAEQRRCPMRTTLVRQEERGAGRMTHDVRPEGPPIACGSYLWAPLDIGARPDRGSRGDWYVRPSTPSAAVVKDECRRRGHTCDPTVDQHFEGMAAMRTERPAIRGAVSSG